MIKRTVIFALIFTLIFLAACGGDDTPAPQPTEAAVAVVPENGSVATDMPAELPTETAVPPTATPTEPLAATVNGQTITLSDYERELARYEQAQAQLGNSLEGTSYQNIVLEALIEKQLITQAAEAEGLVITPEMVDEKMAELQTAAGGAEPFSQWLALNQWTEADFRDTLTAELVIGQMRDRVTADVAATSEQVNARYIQVDNAELAQTLHQRATAGDDFAFLAQQNSLDQATAPNGGELGFFARGSLLVPEVETAAFALQQPGDISEVISVLDSETGQTTYYLVQLIERDMERPLTAELRYNLLQQTFQTWLSNLWDQATIELLIDTN
ncbi:MAG: SurA N-terminal domain-containing protein [Anaerolineae bacterium]|nr:SurA N-terminal domain-containing protein [Anaerolineae bacterium]